MPKQLIRDINGGDLQSFVKYIIQSSKSVLDIGCGIGDYLKYTSSSMKVTAVEPHLPYIEVASKRIPWATFHNIDGISYLTNSKETFDCILLIDVVEHLNAEESIKLINLAKEHSNNIIFSQIPIGQHEQRNDEWNLGGEYWQTHRSTWTHSNINTLGFSYVEIWKDWYKWDESIDKSKDTSIALWIKNYGKDTLPALIKNYTSTLEMENFLSWQKAYEVEGYNSIMGDHSNYFYNGYLAGIGFYEHLEKSDTIIEYGAADGAFMEKFAKQFPAKRFILTEYSIELVNKLKNKFSSLANVDIILNYPEISSLSDIDLSFSFLLSQSMPKTLWINHLKKVKTMLSKNGCYIFQFAYHLDGSADDQIQNGIYGNNKYKPDEIFKILEDAGYNGCDLSVPVTLEKLNSDITWYFCRAY